MRLIIKVLVLTYSGLLFSQTNLLDTSTWIEGASSAAGFNYWGDESENTIEYGTGPHGDNVLLWKSAPNDNNTTGGGWHTNNISIDNTKTYRFTVWAKKTTSNAGFISFGFYGATLNLSDQFIADPHFLFITFPNLDKWYLMVGYVHDFEYSSSTNLGGYYDLQGNKISGGSDFKFQSNAVNLRQEIQVSYNANSTDTQFFYAPTLYEVNGLEPTIEELLQAQPAVETDGYWNLNTNNQHVYYTDGNVGIGTSIPDSQLTVKGTIHSEEVKVDLSVVPAPDYVFESNYNLTSLEELHEYIKVHGHLPNIPSAMEMEANGVELGLMNMKLLEKIEELTLYILKQQEALNNQQKTNKRLEEELIKIKELISDKKK